MYQCWNNSVYKLGILIDIKIIDKINLSQISRELNKDTRTIKIWINLKSEERIPITRNKQSQFDIDRTSYLRWKAMVMKLNMENISLLEVKIRKDLPEQRQLELTIRKKELKHES